MLAPSSSAPRLGSPLPQLRYARKMEAVSAEFDYLRLPGMLRKEVQSYLNEVCRVARRDSAHSMCSAACMRARAKWDWETG